MNVNPGQLVLVPFYGMPVKGINPEGTIYKAGKVVAVKSFRKWDKKSKKLISVRRARVKVVYLGRLNGFTFDTADLRPVTSQSQLHILLSFLKGKEKS